MPIPTIKPGDTIRAAWLNSMVKQINANARYLDNLGTWVQTGEAGNEGNRTGSGGGGVSATSIIYVESSRTATSRTITDSASDTHTVSLATQIVMVVTGAAGGMPSQITLRFQPS